MLPKPDSSFTIPSIHDDTNLECHLYHPSRPSEISLRELSGLGHKGAIIAHPYAPLGGCIDDHVLHSVGCELLKQGYVLGLFNFRGAGSSGGKTSWTARPEQLDYISFVGFLIHYLHDLDTITPLASPIAKSPEPTKPQADSEERQELTLLLGGYSYGSLIVTRLPDMATVLSYFSKPKEGSAAAEVRLRASHLAAERNHETQYSRPRGRTLTVDGPTDHATVYGGEECAPGSRRLSRESRRSMDVVRKGVKVSKARLHLTRRESSEQPDVQDHDEKLEEVVIAQPRLRFLLISPLLPPVSSFLSMFGKAWRAPGVAMPKADPAANYLKQYPTLAVYGDHDFFTSHRGLEKWARGLASTSGSKFTGHDVSGAGHFWQEDGVLDELKQDIREWLLELDRAATS